MDCKCGETANHQHLGILKIGGKALRLLFQSSPENTWSRIREGLPNDAWVVDVEYDIFTRSYEFCLMSLSFPSVREDTLVEYSIPISVEQLILTPDEVEMLNIYRKHKGLGNI